MARQEKVQKKSKARPREKEALGELDPRSPEAQAKAEALKADLDEVLDEIDKVLEQNAEEFINAFVQKGGE